MLANFPYAAAILLVILGLYAALFRRNLVKIAIGLTLVQSGVNLFLVAVGYRRGGIAPIYTYAPGGQMVLPTPQALTLTSIVIGLATTALLLAIIIVIYRHYGTLDADRINRLKG